MNTEQPLIPRLARVLNRPASEIEEAARNWPLTMKAAFEAPCWPAPRQTSYKGYPRPTPRVVMTAVLGPLHESWRLKRFCMNLDCANPLHHELTTQRLKSSLNPPEPLPLRALEASPEFLASLEAEHYTVDDIIDLTLREEKRDWSAEKLAAHFDNTPIEIVEEALRQIHEQGL